MMSMAQAMDAWERRNEQRREQAQWNDRPEVGKVYRLTGKADEPSVARGDGWKQSQVA